MKQIINTPNAPKAIGPYSQAVKAGDFLYISGQLPADPMTGALVGDDTASQTAQVLTNLKTVAEAAGMGMENIIKVNVYLADMNAFSQMNEVYSTFFTTDFPARAAVEVSKLPKGALVEIEAVAYKK